MATDVNFGIVINLGGKDIPLRPKQVAAAAKQAAEAVAAVKVIDVGLPDGMKVDLGAVGNDLESIVNWFDLNWTIDSAKAALPEELKPALEKLFSANLSIEQLHLRLVKGATAADNQKLFTLGMSLTWTGTDAPSFAGVKLKGIYLNVTNEGTTLSTT